MSSFKEFQDIAEPYKGTLVIGDSWTVCRLIDVVDGGDDYYWVLKSPRLGTYKSTCVGSFIPLKGKIDDKDYNELERVWALNEKYWKP